MASLAWCPSSCRLTVEETSDRSMMGCGCALLLYPLKTSDEQLVQQGSRGVCCKVGYLEVSGKEGSWEALRARARVAEILGVVWGRCGI